MPAVHKKTFNKATPSDSPMNDKFESQRKEDSRMVKGVFQNIECRGGNVEFAFRKWRGDKIGHYNLVDGEEYELPLSVVRHLNSGCNKEEHSYLLGPDGKHVKSAKQNPRFAFKSKEYL